MSSNLFNVVYAADTSSEPSHVQSFHSTAKWNDHFDAIKETDKLMVIDFTAKWCGPCKLMNPTMKDFAAKYTDVEFIKLDVDELMGVSQTYQVYSLPTFLLVKKGKAIDKVVGVRKEELQRMIEKHIN